MANERTESTRSDRASAGSDRRPPGLIASIAFGIAVLAVLTWQFAGVADDGVQIQVLDPGLDPAWKTLIVMTVGLSTACNVVVWVRRRWTMPSALVNTAANWVAAAVVIALTVEGALFAPTLPERVGTAFETTTEWSGLTEPFLLIVAGIAIWDSLDGILRARRGRIDAPSRPEG